MIKAFACYIAFGDGKKIGGTEERLLKRISELSDSQPSDYVNGKQAAFNSYLKSLNSPMFLPDMGWFNYVRESRKRIKNFGGAVEALANFKKCTPASATLIVQETIDKFTAANLKKGCDSFLAKTVAEEEAFEELAQLIYGRDASK